MAIPKTMDNDVFGTDYCIGFSTAVTRSAASASKRCAPRRQPRAHRGGRAVRPQLRRDGADLRLPGRCRPHADRRSAVRHRAAGRIGGERPRRQSLATTPSLPSPKARSWQSGEMVESGPEDAYGHRKLGGIGELIGDRLREAHRHRHPQPAAQLPDARRPARSRRPHGGAELRHHGRAAAR